MRQHYNFTNKATSMAPAMMEEQHWETDLDTDDYKQTVRLAKGLAAHNVKQLPEDYHLGEHDVICGRGRKCFQHTGNQRFRKLVADMLPKYSESPSKLDKTFIICDVVNRVRENSPNGGFVKKDPMSGRYFEVGDFLAREKTSQAFRDALHDQYKSSNAAKKKRRLQDQGIQIQRQSSTSLLNTSSMHDYHSDVGGSNNFDPYCVDQSNFLLVEQPERQTKMQKRYSAPHINVSFMDKTDGDNYLGATSAHNFMLNDYSTNAFKFQRNDQAQQGMQQQHMPQNMGPTSNDFETMQQSMCLPSSEFKSRNFVPLSSFKPSKRHSFAGQFGHESMRCIIDEARQTAATTTSSSEWFNGSCPNLADMDSTMQPVQVEPQRDEHDDVSIITFTPSKNMFGERHHSEPRLGSILLNQSDVVTSAGASRERENAMPTLSQSARRVSNTWDVYDRPTTPVNSEPGHCDHVELSPIGDGTTCGLFDLLEGYVGESSETISDDLFAPLPF